MDGGKHCWPVHFLNLSLAGRAKNELTSQDPYKPGPVE